MTWDYGKSAILNLGFEKPTAYAGIASRVIEAANRAMVTICAAVRPLKKVYTVTQSGDTVYELCTAVTDFMKLLGPVTVADTDTPARYIETSNSTVKIFGTGSFDIHYAASPERITAATLDSDELPLQDDLCELAVLLAAYFIWLDDDVQKASMYWNAYDDLRNQIMVADVRYAPITARVNTDIPFQTRSEV